MQPTNHDDADGYNEHGDDQHGDDGPPASNGPMISGKLVVGIVAALGILGAASGWLYMYDQRRLPREFWGFESPRIFREAQTVSAQLIKPESVGSVAKPEYYPDLFPIDALRYYTIKRTDITKRPDLPRLREMLVDHKNFDRGFKVWKEPEWRFCLIFEDLHEASGAKYTASIIFDSECKFARPQSVNKTISIEPMAGELLAYFEEVFPQAKTMPKVTVPSDIFSSPVPATSTEPTTPPTATGAPLATGAVPTGIAPAGGVVPLVGAPLTTDPAPTAVDAVPATTIATPASTSPIPAATGPAVSITPSVPAPGGAETSVFGGRQPVVGGSGLPPALDSAFKPQGLQLPGVSPGQTAPTFTPPPNLQGLPLPGGLPGMPAGGGPTFNPNNPLDFSAPRSITLPQLGNPAGS